MTIGRADRFRRGSWLERSVDRLRGDRRMGAPSALRRLHEIVLDRLPGDHLVSVLPAGERIRLTARHRSLSWNPEEYRAFRDAVRPGAIVLDVGANVGAYTLLFAQWAGPSGRVVAFEPSPSCARSLGRHLQLNGGNNVEVLQAAVCDAEGAADFFDYGAGGSSSLIGGDAHRPAVSVRTTTIDAFCGERALVPDVVKVDVEGAELEVLKGARRTFAAEGTVVFVEFHPSIWRARNLNRSDVSQELEAQGFEPEPLDPAFDPWSTEGVCVRLRRTRCAS